jgi:apoptosis-inducing factor 2
MAHKAGLHASIVAKNIISLLKGQVPTAVYKPTTGSEMMALPMGKLGGVSYLAFFGGMFPKGKCLISGFTLGNWATKTLKGKGLFIGKARAMLRY